MEETDTVHLAQLVVAVGAVGRRREGRRADGGRVEGVKENEPTDNPICSTEPVMPGCGSTCS